MTVNWPPWVWLLMPMGFPNTVNFNLEIKVNPKHLKDMILEMEAGAGIRQKATVVMDAGMAGKENIE